MLFLGWQYGVERQKEMLREAEKHRQLNALRQPGEPRNHLLALRVGVGRILIVLGRLVAPGSSEPVPDVAVRLKTSL
jgi:hypothetical protein